MLHHLGEVEAGFDVDIAGLQAGNTIKLNFTDTATGKVHNVTLMRVDDPSALPLSASVTPDPNDEVIGIDWSGGISSALTQLNALYGGLAFLQDPKNRALAIKLIAEIDEIPDNIAEAELDGNIVKLSKDGKMEKDWMNLALDMARMIGMTDLAPVEDIYLTTFKPVPTMV